MQIRNELPVIERLLAPWRETIGVDFQAYRNHLYRLLHFYSAQQAFDAESESPVAVAAVFHDLGVWAHRTFDYLEPSATMADAWLEANGHAGWKAEVRSLIVEHHKLRTYSGANAASVDAFRRADWIDVSLGLLRFGLPAGYIREVRAAFPNSGFHPRLLQLSLRQLLRHPLHPLPMMKY